ILRKLLSLTRSKWVALFVFLLLAAGITYAGIHFTRAAIVALPDVAEHSIPSASAWAQARQIQLPFTDFDSLRDVVIETLKEQAQYVQNVAQFARATTAMIAFGVIGVVIAVSLIFNSRIDSYFDVSARPQNLYSAL